MLSSYVLEASCKQPVRVEPLQCRNNVIRFIAEFCRVSVAPLEFECLYLFLSLLSWVPKVSCISVPVEPLHWGNNVI